MRKIMFKQNESGLILVYGLVLLMVITIVGTATVQSVLVSEKMTGNYKDESIAVQRASSALVEAEVILDDMDTIPDAATLTGDVWELGEAGGGMYVNSEDSTWIMSLSDSWWDTNANSSVDATDAEHFTEFVTFIRDTYTMKGDYSNQNSGRYFYRITAKSNGDANGRAVVQSFYAKRFE